MGTEGGENGSLGATGLGKTENRNGEVGSGDHHTGRGCANGSIEEQAQPRQRVRYHDVPSPCFPVGGRQVAGVKGAESRRVIYFPEPEG